MSHFDVIVLGGGAAGLMCAATAGQRQRKVLVLDSSNKVGKKILMSGGGRCNFTNLYIEPDKFLSANPHFCKSALKRYTQWDFIALVERYGIKYHEREHGQLFCDESAKDILGMLLEECRQAGVQIRTECEIGSVTQDGDYQIQTSQGSFSASSLVVATGGLSIPRMGATGFGYDLARQFGLSVLPLRAGLVPFMFSDDIKQLTEHLSGISLEATMTTGRRQFTEQLLFTHRGLSGPVVLQLSNYWTPGEAVEIDLLPGVDVYDWLKTQKSEHPKSQIKTLFTKYFPKKLTQALETLMWPTLAEKPIGEIADASLSLVANQISGWVVKPSATEGYRTAEVTLGGVDTDALSSKTMECKTQPGLYFIGEVVDVTGHLGGFNFQWAWASGVAAGQVV